MNKRRYNNIKEEIMEEEKNWRILFFSLFLGLFFFFLLMGICGTMGSEKGSGLTLFGLLVFWSFVSFGWFDLIWLVCRSTTESRFGPYREQR